jgi:multicomponent Na+:H+ antiporter subunit D
MFVGSIAAMYQTHIKRLLAYSSMAQIGYMTLGLSMNSVEGLTGGLVHLFNHGLMKGGLFLVVANITFRLNSSKIEDMAGLARKMPWTSLAFAIGGLSLIGVPGTAGFISKWYLVQGALVKGQVWLALLILMSSLLAVGYVWKVIEVMLLKPPTDRVAPTKPAPLSMIWPVWVMIGSTVVFGLWTTWTGTVAEVAAETLMGLR